MCERLQRAAGPSPQLLLQWGHAQRRHQAASESSFNTIVFPFHSNQEDIVKVYHFTDLGEQVHRTNRHEWRGLLLPVEKSQHAFTG